LAIPINARLTFLAGLAVLFGTISGLTTLADALLPSIAPEATNPAVFKKLSLDTLFAMIFAF
jgi:hypothetical protein